MRERLEFGPMPSRRRAVLLVLLGILTFLVFARTLSGTFVTWDDEPLIYANPNIVVPTVQSLRWHWEHPHVKLYIPVIYTAWWSIARLEQARSGVLGELSPTGFHLANLAVHATSVCVVFVLLRKLMRRDWPAAAGAALFAVHPLQVEAVAWATGMKDLLGGMLSLAAVTAYVAAACASRATADGSATFASEGRVAWGPHRILMFARWLFATLLFALALLAKPSAVVTPLLAGVLDYLLIRRNLRSAIYWLWPWAILSAIWVIVTIRVQPSAAVYGGPIWARPLIAGDALAFYLGKLFWPINLAIDYGRTPASVLANASVYRRWVIPAMLGALVWRSGRPELRAAGLWLLLALLPVLGFVRFEFQAISTVADRYAYAAMLGPALALAYAANRFPLQRTFKVGACAAVIGAYAVLSFIQTSVWRDSASLYGHTIAINPQSLTATHDLAVVYDKAGESKDAVGLYLKVLEISPGYAEGWDDLASALPRAEKRRPDLSQTWAALHERVADYYSKHARQKDAQDQLELARRDGASGFGSQ